MSRSILFAAIALLLADRNVNSQPVDGGALPNPGLGSFPAAPGPVAPVVAANPAVVAPPLANGVAPQAPAAPIAPTLPSGLGVGDLGGLGDLSDFANGVDPAILNGGQMTSQPGWIVSLLVPGEQCGGSLIAPGWVLTAAHCFPPCGATGALSSTGLCNVPQLYQDPNIKALVGGVDRYNPAIGKADPKWHVSAFAKVYVHPKFYVNGGLQNPAGTGMPFDVALVQLKTPAPSVFKTIAYNCDINLPARTDNVVSYGWGLCQGPNCKYLPNGATQILQTTGTKGLAAYSCPAPVPSDDFCLKGNGPLGSPSGTCKGDSGGPNVMPTGAGGKPLLVGITSFGNTINGQQACQSTSPSIQAQAYSGLLRTGSVCSFIKTTTGVAPYAAPRSTSCITPLRFPIGVANTTATGGTCVPNNRMPSGTFCMLACDQGVSGTQVKVTCLNGVLSPSFTSTSAPITCKRSGCQVPGGYMPVTGTSFWNITPILSSICPISNGKYPKQMLFRCPSDGAAVLTRCIY